MKVRVAKISAIGHKPENVNVTGTDRGLPGRLSLRVKPKDEVTEIYKQRRRPGSEGEAHAKYPARCPRARASCEASASCGSAKIESRSATNSTPKADSSENPRKRRRHRPRLRRCPCCGPKEWNLDNRAYDLPGPFDGTIEAGHVEQGNYARSARSRHDPSDLDPILVVGNIQASGRSERSRKAMNRQTVTPDRWQRRNDTGIGRSCHRAEPSTRTSPG